MQLYPNFTAQPGLKVIKKINIDSITQLRYGFYRAACNADTV